MSADEPTSGMTTAGETTPARNPENGVAEEYRRRVHELAWFHSIDVGHGVVTPGLSVTSIPGSMLPDFQGKTVLDIGAWDGYYSYLAERRGASRVVALDHYVWGVDIPARNDYWNECAWSGRLPDHRKDVTDFWRPDLPGKRGFDLAHELLDSKVESVVGDFATMDLEPLGTFDIVIYAGVLYHMKEPLTCLERVRAVTREVAVVETEALNFVNPDGIPICEFRAGNEVNGDFGNWWVPDITALQGMCRAAGFSSTTVMNGPPPATPQRPTTMKEAARWLARRWLDRGQPRAAFGQPPHFRAVVHARA